MYAEPLLNDRPIPLVPEMPAVRSERDAVKWAAQQAEAVREIVSRRGVVLIRGFDIATFPLSCRYKSRWIGATAPLFNTPFSPLRSGPKAPFIPAGM